MTEGYGSHLLKNPELVSFTKANTKPKPKCSSNIYLLKICDMVNQCKLRSNLPTSIKIRVDTDLK